MKTIALIACCSQKLDVPAPAGVLYISDLFRKSMAYARLVADEALILSAEHGLVDTTQEIAPYDTTLNNADARARRNWAIFTATQIAHRLAGEPVHLVILAGRKYRDELIPLLRKLPGVEITVPMAGLGIGQQKAWLLEEMTRIQLRNKLAAGFRRSGQPATTAGLQRYLTAQLVNQDGGLH